MVFKLNHQSCHEKTCFLQIKNKGADQLCCNPAAGQRFCFHYIDSTIPLLSNHFKPLAILCNCTARFVLDLVEKKQNIKLSSFKSSENIQKKEGVLNNKFSSVTRITFGSGDPIKLTGFLVKRFI